MRDTGPKYLHVPLLCAALLVILGSLAHTPVQGQEATSDQVTTDQPIEEIVVVGSRIKRRDFATPSPVTTIDRESFLSSGQSTLEETLNRMPQVVPVSARANNSGDGTATVDLRGLGPGRSLVLLDGRRVAPTGLNNAVDLNTIPQMLIERVEIITGGTSTIYGSDAIAGAINFVTRRDYEGLDLEAATNMSHDGDAESYEIAISYGHRFADDRAHIALYANLVDRQPLLAADRPHTRLPLLDDWEGNVVQVGSWSTPSGVIRWPLADLGSGPVFVTFNPDGTPRAFEEFEDEYNYRTTSFLQVPLDRLAVGLMSRWHLSGRFEAYVEASHATNEPSTQHSPVPAWTEILVNLDSPVLVPETRQLFADQFACAPGLACLSFDKRLQEVGARRFEFEYDSTRFVTGVRGQLTDDWDIDGWISYTKGSSTTFIHNGASYSRYLQGLLVDPATGNCFDDSGGCVPLDVFGENRMSPAGADFIRMPPIRDLTEQSQQLASVYVTGTLIDAPAGPVGLAFGAEWRRDDTEFRPDEVLFTGEVLGVQQFSPVDGREELFEIYAESIVPLATDRDWFRHLEIEFGARYSDYRHAGGVWSYKAGLDWRPADALRFRLMHQRSTRAPNSIELFEEQSTDIGWAVWRESVEDPCSASADPVGNNVAEKCLIQGLSQVQIGIFEATPWYPVRFLTGGNTDLKPEVGKTWTAGFVLSPSQRWTLSADYYSLAVTDTVGNVDVFGICFDSRNTDHVFCDRIQRDASGNMADFDERTSNRGLLSTTGIDVQVQYAMSLPGLPRVAGGEPGLEIGLYWSHTLTHEIQENPVTEMLDCAGYFGWPCNAQAAALPRNRVATDIAYSSGPLGVSLQWRWIDGTRNAAPKMSYLYGYPDPDLAIPVVERQHYLDLGITYEISDTVAAYLGVNNVFDTDPPLMEVEPNTDTGLYDVFGRSYYLRLSKHF